MRRRVKLRTSKVAKQFVRRWKADYGDFCPGWGTAAHNTPDLVADHILDRSKGGPGPGHPDEVDNLQVLCRGCNSRKRHRKPKVPPPARSYPSTLP